MVINGQPPTIVLAGRRVDLLWRQAMAWRLASPAITFSRGVSSSQPASSVQLQLASW